MKSQQIAPRISIDDIFFFFLYLSVEIGNSNEWASVTLICIRLLLTFCGAHFGGVVYFLHSSRSLFVLFGIVFNQLTWTVCNGLFSVISILMDLNEFQEHTLTTDKSKTEKSIRLFCLSATRQNVIQKTVIN